MGTLYIRNVPQETIVFLDRKSKAANMSREEYMRRVLANMTAKSEIEEIEGKYTSLVKTMADTMVKQKDGIEEYMIEIVNRLDYISEFLEKN